MPILTLKFKNNVIKIYNFKKDKSIGIGRRENNDIVISNLTVSGNHAKIDYTDNGFLLTDLKSKNKTFVNGEEVTTAILNDRDVIGIGKHTLLFTLEKDEHIPSKGSDMDRTMAINPDVVREMNRNKKSEEDGQNTGVGMLVFIEGGEGKIELTGNTVRIGKDPANDIVIQGFFMGKFAAIIKKTQKGYTLSYGGGLSKITVNNSVVKHTVVLDEFDVIKIGNVEFQFCYK